LILALTAVVVAALVVRPTLQPSRSEPTELRIVFPGGKMARGAILLVERPEGHGFTHVGAPPRYEVSAASGTCVLDPPWPPPWVISAYAPVTAARGAEPTWWTSGRHTVPSREEVPGKLRVGPPVSITGRIVDAMDGRGIAARLEYSMAKLHPRLRDSGVAEADESGRFVIHDAPYREPMAIDLDVPDPYVSPGPFELVGEADVLIAVRKGMEVLGRVLGPGLVRGSAGAQANEDGSFRLDRVPEGVALDIIVFNNDRSVRLAPKTFRGVRWGGEELVLPVSGGHEVRGGVVLDGWGSEVRRPLTVTFMPAHVRGRVAEELDGIPGFGSGEVVPTDADPEGYFRILGLASGEYWFVVRDQDRNLLHMAEATVLGDWSEIVRIPEPEEIGVDLVGAEIDDDPSMEIWTEGTRLLAWLGSRSDYERDRPKVPRGPRYTVMASADDRVGVASRLVPGGAAAELRMRPGRQIRVRVRVYEPREFLWLVLSTEAFERSGVLRRGLLDEFVFEALPPGAYRLEVRDSARRVLAVVDGLRPGGPPVCLLVP
jgi:hypothetical protein